MLTKYLFNKLITYKPWKVFRELQETMLSLHSNLSLQEVVYVVEQPPIGKSITTMRFQVKYQAEILKCVKIKMI